MSNKTNDVKQFPLTGEEIQLLTQIGLLAASSAFAVPAIRLFDGLRVVRPAEDFFLIGLALSRMAVGAFQDAIRILREDGSRIFPNSSEIKLYLSIALFLAKQPHESKRMVSELLRKQQMEPEHRKLAESVFTQIEHHRGHENTPMPARVGEIRRLI